MLMVKWFDFALGRFVAELVVESLLDAQCPGAHVDVRAPMSERRCPSAHCVGDLTRLSFLIGVWPSIDDVWLAPYLDQWLVTLSLLGTLVKCKVMSFVFPKDLSRLVMVFVFARDLSRLVMAFVFARDLSRRLMG
ncbi:unnamed protein product [Cochlearia groenlandica]